VSFNDFGHRSSTAFVLSQLPHTHPSSKRVLRSVMMINPVESLRLSSFQIPSYQMIPNTSIQKRPLLVYHSAFRPAAAASEIESHLQKTGVVVPQWRYTMYSTTHFHSTTHEVLAISRGKAKLCFGGEKNAQAVKIVVEQGDVVVVPAGVGHRLLEDLGAGSFEMIGSYPPGKQWDICYGQAGEEERVNGINMLAWFERDPIYGDDGPALRAA